MLPYIAEILTESHRTQVHPPETSFTSQCEYWKYYSVEDEADVK